MMSGSSSFYGNGLTERFAASSLGCSEKSAIWGQVLGTRARCFTLEASLEREVLVRPHAGGAIGQALITVSGDPL